MTRDGGISSLSTSARSRERQSPEARAAEIRAQLHGGPVLAEPVRLWCARCHQWWLCARSAEGSACWGPCRTTSEPGVLERRDW